MKTCVAFRLAALASSLLFSFNSLHAADAPKAAKPGPGAQPAVPAAAPKPAAAPAPGLKPPGTPAANATAPAPGATALPALPDLMVEKPVLEGFPSPSIEWTIRNIGDADAHSTTAVLKCEVLYSGYSGSTCGIGLAAGTLSIPPLGKGQSFKHKIKNAAILFNAWTTAPSGELFRVRFSAEVDPEHKVSEKSSSNNTFTFLFENFSGPPPGAPVSILTPDKFGRETPGKNLVDPAGGAINPDPGGITKVQPILTLKTEDPWNPLQSNWIQARNNSFADAPSVVVKVTCLNKGAVKFNEEHPGQSMETRCGFLDDFNKSIAALAKGQSANVMQFQPPQYVGYPYQITFKLQGVGNGELVLSKP